MDDLGPLQGIGRGLDSLFKKIPKEAAGSLAAMLVFACGLRWHPQLDPPLPVVYQAILLLGMFGSMLLTLQKLRSRKP
jgi:hypothetical protein